MAVSRASHATLDRSTIGPVTHVRIGGAIDETFPARQVAQGASEYLILDVGRVTRISSFGVRLWMELTRALPEGGQGLYVVNAPPCFVDQLSMVEGFAGVATVLSVLAPYQCGTCNEERLRLVDLKSSHEQIAKGEAPAHTCPVCGNALEFADNPSEYFAYLRSRPVGDVAPVVDHYLKALRAPDVEKLPSHLKVVEGDITFIRIAGPLRSDLNIRRLAGGLQGVAVYDLGQVSAVEPDSAPKLVQLFTTASAEAKVYLWRVPMIVLDALVGQNLPEKVAVCTLYLQCECKNCGEKVPQRILAAQYAIELADGRADQRICPLCGGPAFPPLNARLKDWLEPNSSHATGAYEKIEALEPRALSQYLGLTAGTQKAASPAGGSGGDRPNLQILRRIGQGGMAEVFLARQIGLKGFEKYVVLKKILPQFATQHEFVEMLFAEARSAARLTHPNIVQTYGVGQMDGSAYITMEYVRGADLRRLMVALHKSGQRLPIEHACCIIAEVASGLHYAHGYVDPTGTAHPIVHRDISPHNVLISFDGAVKISDFGIAKAVGDVDHTQPGMLKGKIGYISPEMVKGLPIDGRADVFALGVMLFELLTLKMPFRRDNDAATLRAITRDPAPDVVSLNPAVPQLLATIVYRALEKDPNKRFTAGELRSALQHVMAEANLHSSPAKVAAFFEKAVPQILAEVSAQPPRPSPNPVSPAQSSSSLPNSFPASMPSLPPAPAPPVPSNPGVAMPAQVANLEVNMVWAESARADEAPTVAVEVLNVSPPSNGSHGPETIDSDPPFAPEPSEPPPVPPLPPEKAASPGVAAPSTSTPPPSASGRRRAMPRWPAPSPAFWRWGSSGRCRGATFRSRSSTCSPAMWCTSAACAWARAGRGSSRTRR